VVAVHIFRGCSDVFLMLHYIFFRCYNIYNLILHYIVFLYVFYITVEVFYALLGKDAVRERNVVKAQRKGRVRFYWAPRARGAGRFRAEPASDALARWTSGARITIGP
jgi:hypothetical protein